MSTNKMTKKDNFAAVRAILVSANAPADLLAFIDHELELLNAKSAKRKPTKTQQMSAELSNIVADVLKNATTPLTIAEIQSANTDLRIFNGEDVSPQRITSILTKFVNAGDVVKEVIKRKTHFTWISTVPDEEIEDWDSEVDDISDCDD